MSRRGTTSSALYIYEEPELFEGFRVTFEAHEEFLTIKQAFPEMTPYERRDLRYLLDQDVQVFFQAVVRAERDSPCGYPRRPRGEAYLGCCHYNSYADFHTVYRDDYYMDMVNEAVEAAAIEEARLLTETFPNLNQIYKFENLMGGFSNVAIRLSKPKARS